MTGFVGLFSVFFQHSKSCPLAAALSFLHKKSSSIFPRTFAILQVLSESLYFLMDYIRISWVPSHPMQSVMGSNAHVSSFLLLLFLTLSLLDYMGLGAKP